MAHRQAIDITTENRRLDGLAPKLMGLGLVLAVVGLGAAIGLKGDQEQLFFHSWLVSGVFWITIGLGGLFYVMIHHLTHAGWGAVTRRLAEAAATSLPVVGIVLLIGVGWGMQVLYNDWLHPHGAHAALIENKHAYLNPTFFWVRMGIYFLVWTVLSQVLFRGSVRQDQNGDGRISDRLQKVSAPGMILFALTSSFFAIDLLMSLKPEWFSTIFGVYFFAGSALAICAFLILSFLFLQRTGRVVNAVTAEHYQDLGKLLFGFGIVFWAYIAFSQFMLIWYASLPEETIWYMFMMKEPSYMKAMWFLLFGHFFAPFLFFVSRHMKRNRLAAAVAATWLLLMHWFDLFLIVMPQLGTDPEVYLPIPLAGGEILLHACLFVGIGGVFLAGTAFHLQGCSLVPERDPLLHESLAFENT